MKNLKRTLGLLLAMIMTLSLPLTAHAAVLSNTASNWNGTYYCVSCGKRLSLDFDEQTDWGHQRGWVCTNSSCDYYINGSGSITQNQRLQYTLNGAHKFGSDGECTICGYYDSSQASCSHDRSTYEYEYDTATYHYCIEYCRDCGEELDSYRERHSLEEDCTYYNSSYHTYESYCPDCDTVIDSQREAKLRPVLERLLPVLCMSALGGIPTDIEVDFPPLKTPSPIEMAQIGKTKAEAIAAAYTNGLLNVDTAQKELKKLEEETGLFGSISDEEIAANAGKSYQDATALRDPLLGYAIEGDVNANATPSTERAGA